MGGNECSFPSANLGVGLSDPAYKLHVSGQIYATSNITAYSDIRIKKDIETIDNALDKVMLMRAYIIEGKMRRGYFWCKDWSKMCWLNSTRITRSFTRGCKL